MKTRNFYLVGLAPIEDVATRRNSTNVKRFESFRNAVAYYDQLDAMNVTGKDPFLYGSETEADLIWNV